jgi:hypothetical protein
MYPPGYPDLIIFKVNDLEGDDTPRVLKRPLPLSGEAAFFDCCIYGSRLGGVNMPTIFYFICFGMNGLAGAGRLWGLTGFRAVRFPQEVDSSASVGKGAFQVEIICRAFSP